MSGENMDVVGAQVNIDDSWISATATYNYMMKDPLIDWLKYNTDKVTSRYKIDKTVIATDTNNFTKYIMEQGKIFESKVLKLITKKFGKERVKEFGDSLPARDPKSAELTLQAMEEGYPIIHGGVLHNPENSTYGIPDLLVRSDWLNKLVQKAPLDSTQENIPSPKFGTNWHYRVVDIKFTCILLRADGTHILNSGSFPAYKAQLLIYNQAVGRLQGYTPDQVYILGRRWKYTSKGDDYYNNTCFDKLGIIDYDGVDNKYIALTEKAIEWVRECRTKAAGRWNAFRYPLDREELYPNMCNTHDYPWHAVKEKIATENKELTCLWMIGVKNRSIALNQGICKYSDPRCTPLALGIKGKKTAPILEAIIEINKPSCRDLMRPQYLENNAFDWHNSQTIEFFIDFETFNGVCSSIKCLPEANTLSMIFMIGAGYIDPKTSRWKFKSFTASQMNLREEARICLEFHNFIQRKSRQHDVQHPRMFHWAPIEANMWEESMNRYDLFPASWTWIDMLKVFKEEPIVIKDCMSYGLKDVASTMCKHGFIKTKWDAQGVCVDGSGAMLAAYKAHKIAFENDISMINIDLMREITKYNEVDVKVICEIVIYLRQNHIEPPQKKSRKRKRKE